MHGQQKVPLRVLKREVTRKQTDKCAHSVNLVCSLLLPTTSRSSNHRFYLLPLCLQKRKTHVLKHALIQIGDFTRPTNIYTTKFRRTELGRVKVHT